MSFIVALAPLSANRIGEQAAKTFILVIVLLIGFRIAGKREIAQFTVYDLAMIIALSNAVQNAMTGGLGNFEIGLATSSSIVVTAWAISRYIARRPRLAADVLGTPTLLVNDGRVLNARCRNANVTPEELSEACREHGVDSPDDCHLAVLEVDGSISIVPKGEAPSPRPKPPARRRIGRGDRGG